MPKRPMTVSDSIVIAAPPARVYAVVADPRRTADYSPENTGAEVDQSTGGALSVGRSFTGTNRRGAARWITRCTVTRAEQDALFEFRVHQIGLRTPRLSAPIATWRYELTDLDGATRVTETWTDDRTRWPDGLARVFDVVATRGRTFAQFQQANIATSLVNLKAMLES